MNKLTKLKDPDSRSNPWGDHEKLPAALPAVEKSVYRIRIKHELSTDWARAWWSERAQAQGNGIFTDPKRCEKDSQVFPATDL